jgi:hypothetical protein
VRPWQVALALAVLHLVLLLLSIIPAPHEGGDNAAYVALARSIQANGTYQELWDPALRPHTQYPPVFPLILAGAMSVGIKPWIGFKVLVGIFSAIAVGLSYLWARRAGTPQVALVVGGLLAIGPGVIDVGRWELSDAPFWAFSMLALWAFARPLPAADAAEGTADAARWKAGLGTLALASAATMLAYATRSAAVPLVVAGGAWLLWKRRWAGLGVFCALVGTYAIAWWLRGRAYGAAGYTSHLWYVDPYRPMLGMVGVDGMLARVVRNAGKYTSEHLPFLLTGREGGWAAMLFGGALLALAAWGWGMRMRRPGLAELWLPLYLGLVLIWPAEWAAARFLLPALPMLLLCAAEPVRLLGRMTGRPLLVGTAAVAVIALSAARPLSVEVSNATRCRAEYGPGNPLPCLAPTWVEFLTLAESLRGSLPPGSAVLSRKATLFWAYSGYPSRTYPMTADPDTLLATAREAHAQYVMLDYMDRLSLMYLAPVLMQRPQGFCVMRAMGPGQATLMATLPGAERMKNVRGRPGNESVNVPFPRCPASYWAPGKAPPDAPGMPGAPPADSTAARAGADSAAVPRGDSAATPSGR